MDPFFFGENLLGSGGKDTLNLPLLRFFREQPVPNSLGSGGCWQPRIQSGRGGNETFLSTSSCDALWHYGVDT